MRTVRFEDNEYYDVVQEFLGTFQAGDRGPIAYAALMKVNAVGVKSLKMGRFQKYTLDPAAGPKEVVFEESERDVALDAVKAWSPATFDLPLKEGTIKLLQNAKSDD